MSKKWKPDPELVISKISNEIIFSWRGDKYLDIDIFPDGNNESYNSYGICILDKDIDDLIKFLIKNRLKS